MRITSIVVPVDLEESGDRALQYTRRLAAAAHLPVELITVSSPSMAEGADRWDLSRRARMLQGAGTDCSYRVLHSDDPAGAIVEHVKDRPGALLAMATHARGLLSERLLGSVSEAVLTHHDGPMLLFGPRFVTSDAEGAPTLIGAVDDRPASEVVLDAAEAWSNAFGAEPPWLIEVLEPVELRPGSGVAVIESTRVRRLAAGLSSRGIEAQWEVLHGKHPADSILEFADLRDDVVVALASERWTDPDHRHLVSVTRAVARGCRHPVLVVPVEGAPSAREQSDG